MLVLSNRHPDHIVPELEGAAIAPALGPLVETAPSLQQVNKLLETRLEIAREGLSELRRHLRGDINEDAARILENLDEDLYLLKRRMAREVRKVGAAAECGH